MTITVSITDQTIISTVVDAGTDFVVLSGGTLEINGGTVSGIVSGSGVVDVGSGGDVVSVTVSSGGVENIFPGGQRFVYGTARKRQTAFAQQKIRATRGLDRSALRRRSWGQIS
jgi:autotransporter passenger strand-loop-strand repeat protein